MAEPARLLVIMGSGETSPTMVTPHQKVFARLGGDGPVPAVLLDTPFGFQENADDLAARAVDYFRTSVGREVQVASYRSRAAAQADPLAAERALEAMRAARWLFAGPGSPSYALRTWAGTPVPDILVRTVREGGAVTFASAAALTLGLVTVPVYEVYKVGADPEWLPGLDVLGAATGLRAAVIPHFDNTEGGNHDTRFCYLGERRLAALEAELPDGAFVLGVDEHTGLVLDLAAGSAAVVGRGRVTVRRAGRQATVEAGQDVELAELATLADRPGRPGSARPPGAGQPATGQAAGAPAAPDGAAPARDGAGAGPGGAGDPQPPASLAGAAAAREQAFAAALAARDVDGAVAALLGLEQDIVDWSRDTLQGTDLDRARAALRGMVVRLGEAARRGVADPREQVAPFVEAMLSARAAARAERAFGLADTLRDGLAAAGVQVRDTPDGVQWLLPADPG